jgi:hypothetical protein
MRMATQILEYSRTKPELPYLYTLEASNRRPRPGGGSTVLQFARDTLIWLYMLQKKKNYCCTIDFLELQLKQVQQYIADRPHIQ